MVQLSFMSWISARVWAGYAGVVATLQAEADESGWYDHEAEDYEATQCERTVEDLAALWEHGTSWDQVPQAEQAAA